MIREISPKKSGNVLYEQAEPLFGDVPKRNRRGMLAVLMLASCIAVIAVTVSLLSSGDVFGKFPDNLELPDVNGMSESESVAFSEETDSEIYAGDETEKSDSFESGVVDETYESSDESINEIRIDSVDLSYAERGDEYITNYTGKKIDVSALIDIGFAATEIKGVGAPVIMIIHTHTSEEYLGAASDSFRGLKSVVSVGERLNEKLNLLGIPSLHCSVIHDAEGEDAYANARDTIETMLEIYPSIKYIIDVHRLRLVGEGGELIRTVSSTIDSAAQIRLTASYGDSSKSYEDLTLALALHSELNRGENRLCMPVNASGLTYNSDLSRYYLLADVGSIGNSADEAILAADRLAIALSRVIAK